MWVRHGATWAPYGGMGLGPVSRWGNQTFQDYGEGTGGTESLTNSQAKTLELQEDSLHSLFSEDYIDAGQQQESL